MRKKKKETIEEYHTGKTTDLRNVIAEIQKVDQETADLTSVVQEAQRVEAKVATTTSQKDAIITCRLLFSSFMDKIFLLLLLVGFIILTFINFKGNLFSINYGFWMRVLYELLLIVLFVILSFICNWLYKCIINTTLSLTRGAIYIERYLPFWKKTTSIPLRHVVSISTINFLWIFRGVIIRQYNHLPIVFYTWNNEKFKTRVDEMIGYDHNNIVHSQNKSMFQKEFLPILEWFMIILIMIIIVLGIAHLFGYIFSNERQMAGSYIKGNQKIVLNMDGTCDLRLPGIKEVKTCEWKYNKNDTLIVVKYEFSKNDYYGKEYETKDKIMVGYKNDALIYNGIEYLKK
ncbi:MAG: hypothetical protein IKQ06_02185 [Bacilli bacterium]|nr:hypothetical protein [Bacilli bacterium]